MREPIHRRQFISALGSAALLPLAARAQEAGRIYRLGILIPATRASIEPFFDELRLNGFTEGQNLVVTEATAFAPKRSPTAWLI
jgi:putative ABC transport system substrate-binding protein